MRFRLSHLIGSLLVAVLLPLGSCQSLGNWAAGQLSPIAWDGETRIELSLTPTRWGSPTVPVRVMGQDATALVDSGASLPVMSRALAVATGTRVRGSGPKVNGKRRENAENVPIQFGSVSTKLGLAVIDDHPDGPSVVLGANLFLQAVVDMDFDAGRLTLINPKTFTPPPQDPLPVKLLAAVPTIQLKLNGHAHEVCAIVDTGYNAGVA